MSKLPTHSVYTKNGRSSKIPIRMHRFHCKGFSHHIQTTLVGVICITLLGLTNAAEKSIPVVECSRQPSQAFHFTKLHPYDFEFISKSDHVTKNHPNVFELETLGSGGYELKITDTHVLNQPAGPITFFLKLPYPWYRTTQAIIGFVFAILTLFFLLARWLLRRQKDKLWEQRLELERRLSMETAAKEAQIRALRQQINSHLLFNSLNFISNSLTDSPSVKESVDRLANFLRHTLEDKNSRLIKLEEEIEFVSQYLAIEHQTSKEDFEITFSIEPKTKSLKVPGLILQPIVENALKYAEQSENGSKIIHVSSNIRNKALVIAVKNSGQWKTKTDEQTPIGLKNVEERLKLQFGGAANLKWENVPDKQFVVVKLILPMA